MLQKTLSLGALSAVGATWSRFVFAVPFAGFFVFAYGQISGESLPHLPPMFWAFSIGGGLAQILATWAVVALFSLRNFAVGITFKKTEVLQAALLGFVVLGDRVSFWGVLAILLGFVGVGYLSADNRALKSLNRHSVALGVFAGALFAISGVAYRGAVLQVAAENPFSRAILTLLVVTLFQTLALALWLAIWQQGEIRRVLKSWRTSIWIGMAGIGGSIGWFAAFSLQNAAYVFAVGQIEVIFSILIGRFLFGEKLSGRETLGIILVTLSILALILLR